MTQELNPNLTPLNDSPIENRTENNDATTTVEEKANESAEINTEESAEITNQMATAKITELSEQSEHVENTAPVTDNSVEMPQQSDNAESTAPVENIVAPIEEDVATAMPTTTEVDVEMPQQSDNTESTAPVEDMVAPIEEDVATAMPTTTEVDVEMPQQSDNAESTAPVEDVVAPIEEEVATAMPTTTEKNATPLTIDEIIEQLTEAAKVATDENRNKIEELKPQFYKQIKTAIDEQLTAFVAAGNAPEAFVAIHTEAEEKFKNLLNSFKEKRAALLAEREKIKEENLQAKLNIIEKIKTLLDDADNVNKHYNEFQLLQQKFKEITEVPQSHVTELWKQYQYVVENFYDLLKMNKELRDYDFKKNLEQKLALCEATEALANEENIIVAFRNLQQLHEEWRTIGPISKELREELWERFKNASAVINKRHQAHFETIKESETQNEVAKTAICEEIENIDCSILKTFNSWEDKTKDIIALQDKWKAIGYTSRKTNNILYERFRKACDNFFALKSHYFKSVKEELNTNLDKKTALCLRAEELKDSTDWAATTEILIALQKEWKTIGSVPKKHSDAVWHRFVAACDYFFEQKGKHTSTSKGIEHENLTLKKEIIAQLQALNETTEISQAAQTVKDLMAKWNTIGHVPFKEKDKIYKEYQELLDGHFARLNMGARNNKIARYTSSIKQMSQGDSASNKLYGEKQKLTRAYEQYKSDLATYENNMGFLHVSKGAGGLLKEMERKMQSLKEEMEVIAEKIKLIDESL